MTNQEKQHIGILALDLLIDSRITALPIDICAVARVYGLDAAISQDRPLWENTTSVSSKILAIFGFRDDARLHEYLSCCLMAPMVVLTKLDIKTAYDIARITGLPIDKAAMLYYRYQAVSKHDKGYTTRMERQVLTQFNDWIFKKYG